MKVPINLVLIIFLTLVVSRINAQESIFTTTAANITASMARLNQAGLSGNSEAIIVATPLGNTQSLNPHRIGAWFYSGKWNIFNTDHATIPAGLTFKVEVFLKRDQNHFLHIITKDNLIGGVSYIDNEAIIKNPNAQLTIFQNHAPDYRSAYLNKYEATTEYDANNGKWYIKNVDGQQLNPDTAYNVVISSGGTVGSTPSTLLSTSATSQNQTPLTVIVRTEITYPTGNYLLQPNICFSRLYENPGILRTDTAIATNQTFYGGKYPTLTTVVADGGVQILYCNWNNYQNVQILDMSNRKVNLIVLR